MTIANVIATVVGSLFAYVREALAAFKADVIDAAKEDWHRTFPGDPTP